MSAAEVAAAVKSAATMDDHASRAVGSHASAGYRSGMKTTAYHGSGYNY